MLRRYKAYRYQKYLKATRQLFYMRYREEENERFKLIRKIWDERQEREQLKQEFRQEKEQLKQEINKLLRENKFLLKKEKQDLEARYDKLVELKELRIQYNDMIEKLRVGLKKKADDERDMWFSREKEEYEDGREKWEDEGVYISLMYDAYDVVVQNAKDPIENLDKEMDRLFNIHDELIGTDAVRELLPKLREYVNHMLNTYKKIIPD